MAVYFSHATSFCGAVWDPVVAELNGVETVVWDQPGHGSGPSMKPPVDWAVFGEHVLDVTKPGGIGVGHSMGAAALAMAQVTDPLRFRALVLIEPVIFPGPFERRESPMSDVALKRRRSFPTREEAVENFAGKFPDWDEAAVRGYVEGGFIGDGPVELACSPDFEADIYRGSTAHDTWDKLSSIEIPVLAMYGKDSDTIDDALARAQVSQFRRAGLEIVEGAGHFLPMEMPGLVADRVSRLLPISND